MKKQKRKPIPAKHNSPDMVRLAKRMKELRIKAGYTSYEIFAYENNLSRALYGRYERGDKDMRYSSLLKVVKAFKMTLEEFFSEGFD